LSDANKASRQNVLGKAAEKLHGFDGHLPLLVAMSIVFPAECDILSIKGQQPVVADCDPVCIPAKVAEHPSWGAERRLRVYHPLFLEE